jgi:1,4-alpha-glucan branching enzyme
MVMGEFNNWKPEPMNMNFKNGRLCYFFEAFVPIGYKYRYQFIINGEIRTDPS